MTTKRTIPILAIALCSFVTSAQQYFGVELPINKEQDYYPSLESRKKAIIDNLPEDYIENGDAKRFVEYSNNYIEQVFYEDYVYPGWKEMEDYLNQILAKLIDEQTIKEYNLHVYPVTDPSINAFALHNGTIFFNVGLLAFAKNEASLAEVMGHEIAHVLNHDGLKGYMRAEKSKNAHVWGTLLALTTGFGHLILYQRLTRYDRAQEAKADLDGAEMMNNAGYNMNSAYYFYRIWEDMDERFRKNASIFNTNSHPRNKDRIKKLEEYVAEHYKGNGSDYLVSKEQFEALQKLAKVEMVKQLLAYQYYNECMERALQFHIFDSDNPIYVYYILESVRRQVSVYLKAMGDMENKNFIMQYHYLKHLERTGRANLDMRSSILKKKKIKGLLYTDEEQWNSIQGHVLLNKDVQEFKSYREAFDYFVAKAEELNCKECDLSAGAYHYIRNNYWSSKPSAKKRVDETIYLNRYKKYENARYPAFAANLTEANPNEALTKELIVVYQFDFTELDKAGSGSNEEAKRITAKYKELMRGAITSEDIMIRFLDDEIGYTPLIEFTDMITQITHRLANVYACFENDEYKLHFMEPLLWKYIHEHKIKRITFVSLEDKRDFIKPGKTSYLKVTVHGVHLLSKDENICDSQYESGYIKTEEEMLKYFNEALKDLRYYCD